MFAERYMMNYNSQIIICYFWTFLKQLVSMQDEDSFESSRIKAFQKSLKLDAFVCMRCSWILKG